MNIFCVIVLLSVTANAFSWSSVGVRTTSRITRTTSLSMVATQPKHKSLEKVKARYSGREDLVSMLDNETDTDDSLSTDDTYELFAEADEEQMDPPQVGENIKGTVIEIDDNGALLEIGGKMSGYLPIKEAALVEPKNLNGILEIGQEITAEVIGTLRGMPVISLRTAQLIVAWDKILKLREADDEFETKIMEVNKGGAVCDVLGLKAFLPGSHYLGTPDQSIIGQTIKVKFLDVIEDEGKLVVSQRRAMSDASTVEVQRGQVIAGTVTGIRNYGAFLELEGGIAGLLHISQISYDRIDDLEKLFTIGQPCKVMILDYDKMSGRIALSTKALEAAPGDMLKDMQSVFANAEANAKKYQERAEAERAAREAAAKDIVAGLGSAMDSNTDGNSNSVAESIESILASIVSDDDKK